MADQRSDFEIREVFKLFDKHGDESVPNDELGGALRCLGLNPTLKDLDEAISKHPTPHDFNALKALYQRLATKPTPSFEQLVEVFKVNDPRRTGTIPMAELQRMLTNLGDKLEDDEWATVAKEFEVSKEGEVDYESAVNLMLA
eukprot:c32768_g1_i1.p1 GENE.c32768_g1_i1~~c32768_g1_i1.p1  ORF type:complete len:143 (+),score=42.87 c32768_g1_i1:47-475(+)